MGYDDAWTVPSSSTCAISAQEAAIEVLRAEFPNLRPRNARTLLRDCRYDIDAARTRLLSLRSGPSPKIDGRRQPNLSYAAALGHGLRNKGDGGRRQMDRLVQGKPSLQSKLQEASAHPGPDLDGEEEAEVGSRRREINRHFLQVFLTKNPALRAVLSPCGREIWFNGPAEIGQPDLHAIKIDLHGLSVLHALQIVGSCLDWLLRVLSPHSATARDIVWTWPASRTGHRPDEITVAFVVGRGLHSMGGRRKLAPAVRQFVEKRGLSCGSQPHDAIVTCCLRIQ